MNKSGIEKDSSGIIQIKLQIASIGENKPEPDWKNMPAWKGKLQTTNIP